MSISSSKSDVESDTQRVIITSLTVCLALSTHLTSMQCHWVANGALVHSLSCSDLLLFPLTCNRCQDQIFFREDSTYPHYWCWCCEQLREGEKDSPSDMMLLSQVPVLPGEGPKLSSDRKESQMFPSLGALTSFFHDVHGIVEGTHGLGDLFKRGRALPDGMFQSQWWPRQLSSNWKHYISSCFNL